MPITPIESEEHFSRILREAQNQTGASCLMVIEFFATWCIPCSQMAPFVAELSARYPTVKFFKADADRLENAAASYNVTTMPTFIFLRGATKVGEVRGNKEEELTDAVRLLAGDDSSMDTASSRSQSFKQHDLEDTLDRHQCECLNEMDSHPLAHALSKSGGFLLSDTDAELIIFITFNQFTKLHSIRISGPESDGPKTVKLFTNQAVTPDFDTCISSKAVQTLNLTPMDLKNDSVIPLNAAKFQNVNTITLFVQDNQSDSEHTRIDHLRFFGCPVNTTNMNEFKRVAGKKGEAHG